MKVLITGATGLLGRNLLFELIKDHISCLDRLTIFILGRDNSGRAISDRIKQIISEDGLPYLALANKSKADRVRQFMHHGIRCFNADITRHCCALRKGDIDLLRSARIDIFFHTAAITDFRDTPLVRRILTSSNVNGTKNALDSFSAIGAGEFCYIGSAYACGKTSGCIPADHINTSHGFRNPYEQTKLEAEMLVRNYFENRPGQFRCFRPSTLSGRLIEQPIGAVSKFDVFYSWAAFFLKLKMSHQNSVIAKYDEPTTIPVRICRNPRSGLNIVPADYAAKVIYGICKSGTRGNSFHIVNDEETSHSLYGPWMLGSLNITGYELVDNMPNELNSTEKLYYRTVGRMFTPYITSEQMNFDTSNIRQVLTRYNLKCPIITKERFASLMEYAKRSGFGIQTNSASRCF